MGKANRDRRRAKLKDRERERKRRDHDRERLRARGGSADQARAERPQQAGEGWRPSPAEAVEFLVAKALHAQVDGDKQFFLWCAAQLSGEAAVTTPNPPSSGAADLAGRTALTAGLPGWQSTVDRKLREIVQRTVTEDWHRGWQPAELVRHVERRFGSRHARLAADAVAGELRGYAAATVDDRWAAQLAALGAKQWWDRDDGYLTQWGTRERMDRLAAVTCLLQTLFVMAVVPEISRLCPLPGTARRGTVAAEGTPARPVNQRMLDRVRALLVKAESTEFPEEAEALTSRAQELISRHSIDEALLTAAADRSGRAGPGNAAGRSLFVDSPYEAAKAVLLEVIATANRCRSIWHKNLGLCTVVGFPAELDAVELLFTSLLVQATTAMVAAGSRRDGWGRSRTRSFRQSFLAAYAQRIGERLSEATGAAERKAAADTPGVNLLPVLAARHRVVDESFEAMFPDLTRFSAGSVNDREGWITGRAAADVATLQGRRAVTGDAA
ncbi:MAG TPA: DUF2786 domain-containing protein [Streptosporangiaceae bacterium]|nr:DUF2786 domain-containing protein [Streptosporangiaceae bacterium]